MIAGLDSAYAPSTASVAAAARGGVKLWAGYFAGRNILNGWALADFDRVRAGGLATLAFCSGWEVPTRMKAQSEAWGVPICLDVEGGIRSNGPWVQPWLDASGAGLYGNAIIFGGKRAAFYVLANYPGQGDPHATWPSWLTRPPGPCGWQWQGTHQAYGASVDSAWYDPAFAAAGGNIGDLNMTELHDVYKVIVQDGMTAGGSVSWLAKQLAAISTQLDAIQKALPAAAGGLTDAQALQLTQAANQAKAAVDALHSGLKAV